MTHQAALITAASRGIGKAIARQLACDGYDVAFCYHSASAAAEEVEAGIVQCGRRVFRQQCCMQSTHSCTRR